MSVLLSPSSTGEISQQRHGSCPQFPSILIISTLEGSGIRINVSKSDDFELHPVTNEDPDREKRSIPDNPSPERMLTSCRLTCWRSPAAPLPSLGTSRMSSGADGCSGWLASPMSPAVQVRRARAAAQKSRTTRRGKSTRAPYRRDRSPNKGRQHPTRSP